MSASVLILERDERLGAMLGRFLNSKGYAVTLAQAPGGEPWGDVTLLSVSAYQRLAEEGLPSGALIVMGTADELAPVSIAAGITALTKPFTSAALLAEVEAALAREVSLSDGGLFDEPIDEPMSLGALLLPRAEDALPPPRPSAAPEPGMDTQNLLRRDYAAEPAEEEGGRTWSLEGLELEAVLGGHAPPPGEAAESYTLWPLTPVLPTDPRGIYGEIPLPQLLFQLFRDLFTGRLVLKRGTVVKEVFLVNGHPVNAFSNIRSESLGYQLKADGLISDEQLHQSVRMVHTEGVRQGEALVRLGAISAESLPEHLKRQVQERLLNCFGWTGAEYGLVYDPEVATRADGFQLAPLVLIFDGIKTSFPVAPLVHHFDGYNRRPCRRTERLSDYAVLLRPFAEELRVAELCDGQRTVGQVLSESPYGLVDTLRILRALEVTQCVAFDEPRAPLNLEPVSTGARAVRPRLARRDEPEEAKRVTDSQRDLPGWTPEAIKRPAEPLTLAEALKQLVTAKHALINCASHYELLETNAAARPEAVRMAHDRLIRRLDPARLETLNDPVLNEQGRQIREAAGLARDELLDPRRRPAYDARLALKARAPARPAPPPPAREEPVDPGEAERAFERGKLALEAEEAAKALPLFEQACRRDPSVPVYRMYRGFTRFLLAEPTDRRARAAAHDEIKAALVEDTTRDEGFVLLGHLYQGSGNVELARRSYQKALGINRRNAQAAEALKRLEGGNKAGGLFGKLFKR